MTAAVAVLRFPLASITEKSESPLEENQRARDKDDLRCLDSDGNIRPVRIIRKWNVPILALVALMTGADANVG